MDKLYSEKIMEHFRNPKNLGEIADADGVGTVGNPNCGDVMRIFIKVKIRKSKVPTGSANARKSQKSNHPSHKATDGIEEFISDIKFQTLGCGAAIASSSIATELVKGKTIDEALKITSKQIAEEMGKFPPAKYHCSILAEEGIHSAIEDYRKKISKS